MGKFLLFFAVFLASPACNRLTETKQPPASLSLYYYTHKLQVGSQILSVEIAKSPGARQSGLSGRQLMANNEGMLFDFGEKKISPAFWMKDMNFDLDFIWIAGGKIVGITANAPPPAADEEDKNLPRYYPPSLADKVLEVNAGWAERNGIKVGHEVRLMDEP